MTVRRGTKKDLLLARMPSGGVCAEIGVWEGDFSARIIELAAPAVLHLVDPWRYEEGAVYASAWYGGKAAGQERMDAVFAGVAKRFAPEVAAGRVVIHRAPSGEAVAAFPDDGFDWIYVDGNHLYEFVKRDLELWFPKVKPGGFLTGDDYTDGGWWQGGVKRAVDEFVAGLGGELSLIGRQFILRKP